MAQTVARLSSEGELLLTNEIDERSLPPIAGYSRAYPLDNTNAIITSLSDIKILSLEYFTIDENGNSSISYTGPLKNALISAGCNITVHNISTLGVPDITTALAYDLILLDRSTQVLTNDECIMLKNYVDNGISAMATGVNTDTNIFVSSVGTRNQQNAYTGYFDGAIPFTPTSTNKFYVTSSTYLGASALAGGVLPLYYTLPENLILGYQYISMASGAVLVVDMIGVSTDPTTTNTWLDCCKYAVGMSKSTVLQTNPLWSRDGFILASKNSSLTDSEAAISYDAPDYAGTESILTPDGITTVHRIVHKGRGATPNPRRGLVVPITLNTNYTLSVKIKLLKTAGSNANVTCQAGKAWPEAGSSQTYVSVATWDEPMGDGWYHYRHVFRVTASSTNQVLAMVGMSNASIDDECLFYDFKVEQGDSLTPSTSTLVTSNDSGLVIKNLNFPNDFTFSFRFKPAIQHYNINTAGYNRYMFRLTDNTTGAYLSYADYQPSPGITATSSNPFLGVKPNSWWVTANTNQHLHHTVAYKAGKWHDWYIIKQDNSLAIRIYVEGTLICNFTAPNTNFDAHQFSTFNLQEIKLGDANAWSGTIKDLAIYPRALTKTETDNVSLNKQSNGVTKQGKLRTSMLISKTGVPRDAYHFPLTTDVFDSKRNIQASEASNLDFSEGAVWVGTGTTNLVSNPRISVGAAYAGGWTVTNADGSASSKNWDSTLHPLARTAMNWSPGLNSGIANADIGYHAYIHPYEGMDNAGCLKFINRNSQFTQSISGNINITGRWLGISQSLANISSSLGIMNGTSMTISANVKSDVANTNVHTGLYHRRISTGAYDFLTSSKSYVTMTNTRANTWERMSGSLVVDNDWDLNNPTTLYLYGHNMTGGESTKWVDNVQVELKPFATPFVQGSRGSGSLEFNLNNNISLDWGNDWTITYWKKPVGTHDNTMAGYNIESLGASNGNYIYYGKTAASDNIIFYVNGTTSFIPITPAKYFNKWHFVMIRKQGLNITIQLFIPGNSYKFTTSLAVNYTANGLVTNYVPAYDFKLGGWDDGSPCNSYYKNLVVAKRALSDIEVETLRSIMQVNKNIILIQGDIKESVIL